MATISFKVSDNTKEELIDYFKDKRREKTPPYAIFQADESDTVVTLYESGKVVFQGISADIDGNLWKQREKHLNPHVVFEEKKTKKEKHDDFVDSKILKATAIGSDEVGKGDFFGPLVVTAAFVDKKDIPYLEELGVKDSKKLDDSKIIEIVPKIIKKVDYECQVLNNETFNKNYSESMNMNKINAILHNKVLLELSKRHPDYEYIIVDEFAKKGVFYHYLKGLPNIQRNITFLTKGETKSIAVACASLISRYQFLKELNKINKEYNVILPKGASTKVDEIGAELVKKYGFDILEKIAKLNFKNVEKIKIILNK